jgi:hypothetical protein
MTPYKQGYADRIAGKGGSRRVPGGDASWSEKLYHRGWSDALREIAPVYSCRACGRESRDGYRRECCGEMQS